MKQNLSSLPIVYFELPEILSENDCACSSGNKFLNRDALPLEENRVLKKGLVVFRDKLDDEHDVIANPT